MPETPPLFLYIEDDPPSRQIIELLITRVLGARLVMFENTENFEDKLSELPETPRVVFLDVHIGPVDGFEVLTILRGKEAYQQTPIIATTASVTSTDVSRLKEVGFDGLIGKPIKNEIFLDLLKRILLGESVWFVI